MRIIGLTGSIACGKSTVSRWLTAGGWPVIDGDRLSRECTAPERIVTAVVPVAGCRMPLSVKTRTPIPKASVPACMQALSLLRPVPPILAGETVLADVCGTGVDIVATRTVRMGD